MPRNEQRERSGSTERTPRSTPAEPQVYTPRAPVQGGTFYIGKGAPVPTPREPDTSPSEESAS